MRSILPYLFMAIVVFIACFGLFYLDKDIKTFSTLLTWAITIPLMMYHIPTFLVCCLLYTLLKGKVMGAELGLAIVLGIPAGFTIVITVLRTIR